MDRVPNSTDVAELVEQFGKNQAAIAGMVKSSLDSLKTFASIKIDKKVKDSLKKMKDVKSTFNTYSYAVREMIDGVSNLLPKNASPDELNKTLSVLSGDPKKTIDLFNDAGKKLSTETTDERKGILDIIGTTLGLIKQISEVNPPNYRKLTRTVRSYSDTMNTLWSFVREFGNAADPTAAIKSAMASKTITDAMLNLTGIFAGIQKDLVPVAEAVSALEPSLRRGMKLLYDPTDDPEKQFSIITTVVEAAKTAEKINPERVKQIGVMGDSVSSAAKSLAVGFGILGTKAVSERLASGTEAMKSVIYDVIEFSNLVAGIDPNDTKSFAAVVSSMTKTTETVGSLYIKIHKAAAEAWLFKAVYGSEPLEWLSSVLGSVRVSSPGPETEKNTKIVEKIVSMMLSSVQHINDMSVKLIVAIPKAAMASSLFSWMIDRLRLSLYSASYSLSEAEIKKTEEAFTALASIGSSMNIFVTSVPSRREVRRALSTMLVVGDMLGDEEVRTRFKSAVDSIELMIGEKDSLGQLNGLLDTVASAMKSAAQAGVWCALGIPGMMLVGLAAKVMNEAIQQLVLVTSGFSKEEIADTRHQFEDLGKMVLLAGATVAVCALVGALVILALPEILLGFAAIGAVVLVFAGLLRLIDLIAGGRQFKSNAEAISDLGNLILMAGAVIAVSVLVGLLVLKAFRLIIVGFAALMTVTVALVGVLYLIGKIGEIPGLKIGMLMLIAMIMSMMLAALMITAVAKVGAGIDLEGILKFTVTLAIISAAYIGLGLLMAAGGIIAVTLATAGIILISLSMLMITGAISSVNNALSKTDPEQTKENISAMLDSVKYTVDYVNDNFSIADMGKAAAKMFLMANMSKHLMRMAIRIQKIASLTMDEFDEAGHLTGKIVKMKTQDFVDAALNGAAVVQTIAAMLDSEPTVITTSAGSFTVTGLSDEVLERITNKNKRKIRQLSKITKFIGKMATTVADIASLNMATEWNEDGKPVSFQKMTAKDFVNASMNGVAVAKLMSSLLDDKSTVIETSVGNVTVKGIQEDALEKITNSAKRKFRQLNKITRFIGRMTETVAKIASLKVATEWNADGKPINFEAITADQMKDAALNATAVVKFFAAVATNRNTTLTMAGGKTLTVEAMTENMFEKVDRELKRKFRFLGQIVNTIAGATKTVTDLASLRVPVAWSADGKPVKYEPITTTQMQAAAENVVAIMTTLMDAVVGEEMTAKLDSFDRSQKRAMERMFTAITPITSMVETVIALAGGSLEEYDAEGHPTGKQVSVLKALEAKPDIINGIVSIYSIFTDALAVITGQDSAAEVTVAQSNGLLGRIVNRVASAVTAVVNAGASMAKNIKSTVDTAAAANNIKMIVDPIMSMVDAVKKINEVMSSVDLAVADNLKYVMAGSVAAVTEIGEKDFSALERRTRILDEYANVIKKFMDANSKKEAADNVHRTMDDTGKFVVQLNKVSDNKLAKMASIAKNMADFARKINGNFDRLADAMNEKMVTALDKVDKTLKEVNKTMNEMPGKFRGAVSNIQVTGSGASDDKSKVNGNGVGNTAPINTKQQAAKDANGKNITGKTVNNCIVQADDGTFALAVIQKYE